MKKRKIALGPGAASLILIVVVLSMSMLGMLTLISARNDERLSLRNSETIENTYTLFSAGERSVAALDQVLLRCKGQAETDEAYLELIADNLPMEMDMQHDVISWQEGEEDRILLCTVRVEPLASENRYTWLKHSVASSEYMEDDSGEFDEEDDEEEAEETEAADESEDDETTEDDDDSENTEETADKAE